MPSRIIILGLEDTTHKSSGNVSVLHDSIVHRRQMTVRGLGVMEKYQVYILSTGDRQILCHM